MTKATINIFPFPIGNKIKGQRRHKVMINTGIEINTIKGKKIDAKNVIGYQEKNAGIEINIIKGNNKDSSVFRRE